MKVKVQLSTVKFDFKLFEVFAASRTASVKFNPLVAGKTRNVTTWQ